MGRLPEPGLIYFRKDVDYYEDDRIEDLLNEYGPLGNTIYDVLLCLIYKDGYYLEFKDLDRLSLRVIRKIGNRWVRKKSFVLQVIHYCAEIGLFDKDLLNRNIITSAGIQKRYLEVKARSKVDKSKYWLIDKDGQPLLNAPINSIPVAEKGINATENGISASDIQQKKSKVNIYIYYENPELNRRFSDYLKMRENASGCKLTEGQVNGLMERLESLAPTITEKMEIINAALLGGWKNFYPVKKEKKSIVNKNHSFNNFEQRSYDFDEMELENIWRVNGGRDEKSNCNCKL